jgi:hypothetical protein
MLKLYVHTRSFVCTAVKVQKGSALVSQLLQDASAVLKKNRDDRKLGEIRMLKAQRAAMNE